jgi:hypothetical protein
MKERLGIDIGGVIISKSGGGSDTSFSREGLLDTPEVPGAFEVISRLVNERFDTRVFLVSKCGPRVQAKTWRWLKHYRFFDRTGVKPRQVYFCLARSEKAEICRRLKITHFIDDRRDVLERLQDIDCLLLDRDGTANRRLLPSIRVVKSWDEIAQVLLAGSTR